MGKLYFLKRTEIYFLKDLGLRIKRASGEQQAFPYLLQQQLAVSIQKGNALARANAKALLARSSFLLTHCMCPR